MGHLASSGGASVTAEGRPGRAHKSRAQRIEAPHWVQVGKLLGVKPGRWGGVKQRGARGAPWGVQAAGSFCGETGVHLDREEQGHKLNRWGRQPWSVGKTFAVAFSSFHKPGDVLGGRKEEE